MYAWNEGAIVGYAPTFDVWTGVLEVAISLYNYFVTYTMCHGSRQSKRKRKATNNDFRIQQNKTKSETDLLDPTRMDGCLLLRLFYIYSHTTSGRTPRSRHNIATIGGIRTLTECRTTEHFTQLPYGRTAVTAVAAVAATG